jgi:hypothetical protein
VLFPHKKRENSAFLGKSGVFTKKERNYRLHTAEPKELALQMLKKFSNRVDTLSIVITVLAHCQLNQII